EPEIAKIFQGFITDIQNTDISRLRQLCDVCMPCSNGLYPKMCLLILNSITSNVGTSWVKTTAPRWYIFFASAVGFFNHFCNSIIKQATVLANKIYRDLLFKRLV